MSLDKTSLLDFLDEIDRELHRKIIIVAVGGTAMTLVDAKSSTTDIDFTIPKEHYNEFERVKNTLQPGFRLDVFLDDAVFSTFLPDDYLEKSRPIEANFQNIDLRALDPTDIIITKIGRLNARDIQDIETCITKFQITRKQIEQRANETDYVGNEQVFNENLDAVLRRFFV